ncbi:MAG: hypothetical protein ACR2L1_00835 [Pyrinomonadaceae bacterium]
MNFFVGETTPYRNAIQMKFFCLLIIICILVFHTSCDHCLLLDNQKLEVVSVKWKPGLESLAVQDSSNLNISNTFRLSKEDVANLKSTGITGQIDYAGSSGFVGRGKPVKVLIVMQYQLKEPVELRQPKGVNVIYIQNNDGWKMYPPNAPTSERTIRLFADEKDPTWATRYSIERVDKTLQGGTLFTW